MEIYKSFFEIPSEGYKKQVTKGKYSLKVEAGFLNIVDALKDFINYDKVAIITRHSIRGEDSSDSGQLTNLGKIAAENVGKQLKAQFGGMPIILYSTNTVRTKDTAALINKGWNDAETSKIDTSKDIINKDYFGVSGTWPEITENVRTSKFKNKVEVWKSNFIDEMPDGLSWWVSHDSLLVPLIYNISDFNPEKYKQLYKLEYLPWVSPLSGIIIAIKNGDIQIKVISCLETGFISSNDYEHSFEEDIRNPNKLQEKNLVATTLIHPKIDDTCKSKPDLSYIFDKSGINSHPLYCNSTYDGCESCIACQNCDNGCQSCQKCDGCNTCQTCYSCQALCQNGKYSWTLYKEKITSCDSCIECNLCVDGYTKSFYTDCNPCNACYDHQQVSVWTECFGCQWGCTTCTSCNGCNDNSVANICTSCTFCNACYGCHACWGCYGNGCYSSFGGCAYAYSGDFPCEGCTHYCYGCTNDCHGCNSCTKCTECQTCTADCHSACFDSCVNCNSRTGPLEWTCDGCTNEQPITSCVPTCETGCYKGCTADNAKHYKRYTCNSLCMTCVDIDDYACTRCYNINYDVEFS